MIASPAASGGAGSGGLRIDPKEFIRARLRLVALPSLPEIKVFTAHAGSGLWRLQDGDDPPPPYWAYHWAGGLVLARHLLERPETARGRRVLDLGTGSGVVGIAAAMSGARMVLAADIDRHAVIAAELNAAANGVALTGICADLTAGPPPDVEMVLVGDLFYDADLAGRVLAFLDRCLSAGIEVLIGDPRRAFLPVARLRVLAEYPVPDFGAPRSEAARPSAVFALEPERTAGIWHAAHGSERP